METKLKLFFSVSCIFTDNNTETKYKLLSFLGLTKNEYKKIIFKLNKSKKIVYGYKIKYKCEKKNILYELKKKRKHEKLIEYNIFSFINEFHKQPTREKIEKYEI